MISSIQKEIIQHRRILLGVVAATAIVRLIFLASSGTDESKRDLDRIRGSDQQYKTLPENAATNFSTMEGAPWDNAPSSRPLVHVFSPYHDPSAEIFAPLNVAQWTMLVSAKNSQERFHDAVSSSSQPYNEKRDAIFAQKPTFDRVILVCAVLKVDAEVLKEILSFYCDHVVVLPRSTADVYHGLKPLPFVKDIINAGRSAMKQEEEEENDYYLMLTNADICPSGFFYEFARSEIRESPAISINRMTIPKEQLTLPSDTEGPMDIKHLFAVNVMQQARVALNRYGRVDGAVAHPGQDCFLLHTSVLNAIDFGDLFLGYPKWASAVTFMLKLTVTHYRSIHSNKKGTFHLGDERTWQDESEEADSDISNPNDRKELNYLAFCPFPGDPPQGRHTVQNVINCGKLFAPRKSEGGVVPTFVRPGYEDAFFNINNNIMLINDHGLQRNFETMKDAWDDV